MLVVSLRGEIFGLSYGVLGKTPLYLAVKVSFCFIYAFHVIKVYLQVKKGWATPRLVSFRDLIQKFRPASRIFEHLKNIIIAHFKRIFTLKRSPRIFGSLFSG